jgi:hypothetical protein
MTPEDSRILEANLSALSRRDAELVASIRASIPDPRLVYGRARNGQIVPSLRLPRGSAPLHSLYDPGQEAKKLVASIGGAGFYVAFGLGAGFLVSALLDDPGVYSILVVEKDAATLRSLLEHVQLADSLGDPRVHVVAGRGGIRTRLLAAWRPALMGGLRTVPLRPWCENEERFFRLAALDVEAALDAVRADYSVQAHFGKLWLTNMMHNMERAEQPIAAVPRSDRACVIAAGPSLDQQIQDIPRAKSMLLASDTALPALLRRGITPDAVLSIDCQVHSYHHFLQGIPEKSMLFLDLASPPVVARRAARVAFVSSAHPFAAYLNARWKRFPRIDMSGGNVTHAALSLAPLLGASHVTLYGADFSYPNGKAYARGTYLYDLFSASQNRVSPAESRWVSFLFRSPDTHGVHAGGRMLYTTSVMNSYRASIVSLMESMEAEVVPVQGEGLSLRHEKHSSRPPGDAPPTFWPQSRPLCGWKDLLAGYAHDLEDLPSFGNQPGVWFRALQPEQHNLLATLLPVAAMVIKETGDSVNGPAALEAARAWTLSRIRRFLSAREPHFQP